VKLGFHSLLPLSSSIEKTFFVTCPLKLKMNIFMSFSICPYDAFNICEKGSNVWLLFIEHDDAHVLLSDQRTFMLCF
jgi:hypothetical protein